VLIPTLRPVDVVVLDNLGSHHVEGGPRPDRGGRVRRFATCRPYSPDFNPIELWFAKLKAVSPGRWRRLRRRAPKVSKNWLEAEPELSPALTR
jgi:transposase